MRKARGCSIGSLFVAGTMALVLAAGCRSGVPEGADADVAPTTVILVRHAEKAEPGDPGFEDAKPGDPPLTAAGRERAEALAHALEEAGVTAVYSSEFRRTRDTVVPLARRLGLVAREHPARDVAGLVDALTTEHRGGVVVIAGHSNTVPDIIAALGAGPVDPIDEPTEYDNLYLVTIDAAGRARVTTMKYGIPSPGGATH